MRHREIAQQLWMSEGELVAAHAGASISVFGASLRAVRLQPLWPAIIEALEPLGELMALTPNESCVHEKTGVYRTVSHTHGVGRVQGGAIDLHLFYGNWAHGFAVTERSETGLRRSLQFFDACGNSVHKTFLTPRSAGAAYEALVARFADPSQAVGIVVKPAPPAPPDKPDHAVDVRGFRMAWAGMRATREFFDLLKNFAISRTQGLRLAEPRFAKRVDKACVSDVLNDASREAVALVASVGSGGAMQRHCGPVDRIAALGDWINVLDPGFNLRVREDQIDSAWIVSKPTVDGLVSSLELFDARGDNIVMFSGARKPGAHEPSAWRAVIDTALREHELYAA
ncbi:putative hemin transport protein [Oxalobacteraceae bacterium GrIS 1.11]